ncbi:MAG: hypothetical protein A3A86_05065 [Elusimicrobia bacterium RIFCSPLOWO2_01_FULL_60_11]|nr:MAG: hypothetical protein A3A86_05065 [Elusimicrobia bacterium RIFCSPLOWO2_01_FULL_60_11]
MPSEIHQELAREAFESGRSINQLCTEAILARKALKNYDPWKGIEKVWKKNKKIDSGKLSKEIGLAIAEARRAA